MFTFLKQRGFLDLLITRGFSNLLIKVTLNVTVNLVLEFFAEVQISFLNLNVLLEIFL